MFDFYYLYRYFVIHSHSLGYCYMKIKTIGGQQQYIVFFQQSSRHIINIIMNCRLEI